MYQVIGIGTGKIRFDRYILVYFDKNDPVKNTAPFPIPNRRWDSLSEFSQDQQTFYLGQLSGRGNFEMFAEIDGILPEVRDMALLLGK